MTIVHISRWPLITQLLAGALVAFLGLDGYLLVKGLRAHSNTAAGDAPAVSPASQVAVRTVDEGASARDTIVHTPAARATPAVPTRIAPPAPAPHRTATVGIAAAAPVAGPPQPVRERNGPVALSSAAGPALVSPAPARHRRSRQIPVSPQDAGPLEAPESPRPVLVGTIMKQGGDVALLEFADGHTRLLRIGEQVGDLILRSVGTGEAVFSNTEGGRVILRTEPAEKTP